MTRDAFDRHFGRILLVTAAVSILGVGGAIRVGTAPLTDETSKAAAESALLREELVKMRKEYAALRDDVNSGFTALDRRVGSLEAFRESLTTRRAAR